MRTDFREERRWKICMAYKLAAAALEWHKAGDRQTRKEKGIVVDWSRPVHDESRDIDDVEMIIVHDQGAEEEMQDDSDERPFSSALISADYGSDDSDDEQELEKQEVADALEPRAALEEALGHAERSESTQPENEIRPKEEDLDDSSMGPTLTPKQHPKPNIYSPLRGHIAHLDYDNLILDFDDLHIHKTRDVASDDTPHDIHPLPPADLLQIFPELPFTFTEPPPLAGSPRPQSAGKKKMEKRDRDDPHRRSDPTTFSKLTAMSPFMHTRPTLLAALNPAIRWEDDHWTSFDDAPIIPDFDAPFKVPDEVTSSAFNLYTMLNTFDPLLGLFDGGKPSLLIPDDDVVLPGTPRDPARRAATDALWTYQDDLLLKQLTEKYPKNWGLVTDLFNSSRGAISLEQRADWECKERYRSRWLGKDRAERDFTPVGPSAQDGPSSTSARPLQSQITTRKRMASVSSTTANMAPTPGATFEPRKRRRHVLIFETMRKCARKREAAQKTSSMYLPFAGFSLPDAHIANNRKAPAPTVHDTHGQFSKLPRLSPAELSRMKFEKEGQEILSRRRAEEAQRQQLLQRMGNGTPGQSHVRSIVYTIRRLICTISRLRRQSRLLNLRCKDKGSLHNS